MLQEDPDSISRSPSFHLNKVRLRNIVRLSNSSSAGEELGASIEDLENIPQGIRAQNSPSSQGLQEKKNSDRKILRKLLFLHTLCQHLPAVSQIHKDIFELRLKVHNLSRSTDSDFENFQPNIPFGADAVDQEASPRLPIPDLADSQQYFRVSTEVTMEAADTKLGFSAGSDRKMTSRCPGVSGAMPDVEAPS